LRQLRAEDSSGYQELRRNRTEWKAWHYAISNAATVYVMANEGIMRRYMALVGDEALRDGIGSVVFEEYALTGELLADYYGASLDRALPSVTYYMKQREATLDKLHEVQIRLLQQWRQKREEAGDAAAEVILLPLLLSVNAIASGLGGTG
jgi:phosphoenolpyruvate carboxylase